MMKDPVLRADLYVAEERQKKVRFEPTTCTVPMCCNQRFNKAHHFCKQHWKMLPSKNREQVMSAFNNRKKRGPFPHLEELKKARSLLAAKWARGQ